MSSNQEMNILMLTQDFPPEVGSASHIFHELAMNMTQRGHKVTVVTTFPRYYTYRVTDRKPLAKSSRGLFLRECMDGIKVLRIRALPLPKGIILVRGLEHFLLPPILSFRGLFSGKQDVMLIYCPPLPLGFFAYYLSKLKGIHFVVNIQDLYPRAVTDQGMLKNRFLIRMFEAIESFVYRKAEYLTVHSEGNREHVISRGAHPGKVAVIPNWVDTTQIKPSAKPHEFCQEYGLDNKFVVSYAGIMSPFQGLQSIIHCAALLRGNKDVLFLMVGDGLERKRLMLKAEELEITNVRFLPMQPKSKYPQVLQASDVCLVTLNRNTKTPVVPAKLLGIMSSGRPVIASVPLEGDVPKIVEMGRCGLVVEPEDPQMLSQAILKLHDNPLLAKELGKNGREYAETHFSLEVCTTKYEELFRKVCRK